MKFTAAVIAGFAAVAIGSASAQSINDAQIASIVVTANQVDIDAGKVAVARGSNAEVKAFGQQMVDAHTGVNKSAVELATRLKVTPEDNATSQALSKQAAETHDRLDKLSGAAFDQAYAKNEVAYHQAVNGALEGTLIPSADNSELKSLLETGLTLFTEHQHHAEHLAAKL